MQRARVSLASIARACGLSVSAVCRALKNDRRIPPSTRLRIRQAAARLGYRADPRISEAFSRVARANRDHYLETLAYLTFHDRPISAGGTDYREGLFAGARIYAESLGYRLEEFWTRTPGMTYRRLAAILRSRGIRGCLLSVCPVDTNDLVLPWDRFACVSFSYTLRSPELHRALPFHYGNIRRAIAEAAQAGYRRVGLVLERAQNRRLIFALQAGYLSEAKERAGLAFAPILELDGLDHARELVSWVRRHRLDLVIASHHEMLPALQAGGVAVPRDAGFIDLGSGRSVPGISHIDQQPGEVARAGVDLLSAMLLSGETGVPAHPRLLLVPGMWRQGGTTRPAQPGAAGSAVAGQH